MKTWYKIKIKISVKHLLLINFYYHWDYYPCSFLFFTLLLLYCLGEGICIISLNIVVIIIIILCMFCSWHYNYTSKQNRITRVSKQEWFYLSCNGICSKYFWVLELCWCSCWVNCPVVTLVFTKILPLLWLFAIRLINVKHIAPMCIFCCFAE